MDIEDQLGYMPDDELLAFLIERQKRYAAAITDLAMPIIAGKHQGDEPVTMRQLGIVAETLIELSAGGTVAFAMAIRQVSERIKARKHQGR